MDLWIFAYGSLMWRPEFHYEEARLAVLEGAHRALCLYSIVHRGRPGAPGLVLGLDKGGHCEGLAFRVSAPLVKHTRAYLHRRENITHAYSAVMKPVKLSGGSHAGALCFIVNRNHRQYAGALPVERQAQIVRKSAGGAGRNIDYVINTVEHLRTLGVRDSRLERLMTALGRSPGKAKGPF